MELPSKTHYCRTVRNEVTVRRRRRHKQLLEGLKERRGYWKLKEEALDRTLRVELDLEEVMDLS